MTLVIIKTDTC